MSAIYQTNIKATIRFDNAEFVRLPDLPGFKGTKQERGEEVWKG